MAARWINTLTILSATLLLGSCGDDGSKTSAPPPIEGLFAQLIGAHQQVFSLSPDEAQVECRPKPALSEFEYQAVLGDATTGSYLQLLLKDYTAAGSYRLTGTDGIADPQVEVGWAGAQGQLVFQGSFSESLRVDDNPGYNSSCQLELTEEKQGIATRFGGVLTCAMLWPSAVVAGELVASESSFVDLIAKFECLY